MNTSTHRKDNYQRLSQSSPDRVYGSGKKGERGSKYLSSSDMDRHLDWAQERASIARSKDLLARPRVEGSAPLFSAGSQIYPFLVFSPMILSITLTCLKAITGLYSFIENWDLYFIMNLTAIVASWLIMNLIRE